MRVGYRFRQFVERARVRRETVDVRSARDMLSVSGWGLFVRLAPDDQAHALCVYRRLLREGWRDRSLLQAALLHDVGKAGVGLSLAHRAVIVLVGRLGRSWLERLASPDPESWRHRYYAHLHHAERGARLCREAGLPPRVVALVRDHERRDSPDEALRALARADDQC